MELSRVEQCFNHSFASKHWKDRLILVAVSGGPDSVACLHAALRVALNRGQVVAAHFNHQWRGNASTADAEFVRQLCATLGVRLVAGSAGLEQPPGARTEERARRCRYQFLISAAYEVGAGYVVTGHTADDRIETMLHNLLRGSGLAGLATPRSFRALDDDLVLVRPLLAVFRHEILDYLNLLQQDFRTDSSNRDGRYARNFIRNDLLPLAREHFTGGVDKQLLSMAELAEEAMLALELLGRSWLEQMRTAALNIPRAILQRLPNSEFWLAPKDGFGKQPWPIVREGLRQLWTDRSWPQKSMSRSHWERFREIVLCPEHFEALIDEKTLRVLLVLPGGLQLISIGNWRGLGMLP